MTEVNYLSFRPNLPVGDLNKSIAFYRDILGLEISQLAPEYGLAILANGGAEVAIFASQEIATHSAYMYVLGVETLYNRCIERGAEINQALTLHPWNIRDFVVKDPDGHLIAIGERVSTLTS